MSTLHYFRFLGAALHVAIIHHGTAVDTMVRQYTTRKSNDDRYLQQWNGNFASPIAKD
jgi:hypothetical protein